MDIDPRQIAWLAALAFTASIGVLAAVASRMRRGQSVLPYAPRRRVPWSWPELVFVMLIGLTVGPIVMVATQPWLDMSPQNVETSTDAESLGPAHPLVVLLHVDRRPGVLLLVFVAAVVVAPIAEEFYFRLMLQGVLEAEERRLRRRSRLFRGLLPGTLPVVTTSLVFGAIHFRATPPPTDPDVLIDLFVTSTIARVITFGLAVGLLRRWSGASAADLGFVPSKLLSDIGLGLVAFAAIAAPLYTVQVVLLGALPNNPIVDPITLTLFALVLGTLYYRTHRIVPSITLHMALNATSIAMAWWLFGTS